MLVNEKLKLLFHQRQWTFWNHGVEPLGRTFCPNPMFDQIARAITSRLDAMAKLRGGLELELDDLQLCTLIKCWHCFLKPVNDSTHHIFTVIY